MRRFRFRLKRLERLRDVRRRQALALMAQAMGRVRDVARQREERERLLAASMSVDPPESGLLDLSAATATARFNEDLRRGLRHIADVEQQARRQARQAADLHGRAAREHRVLERLREQQRARWLRDTEMEEQKFLDEIHRTAWKREAGGNNA